MLVKNATRKFSLQKIIFSFFFFLCFLKLFLYTSNDIAIDYISYFNTDFFHFIYDYPILIKFIILFLLLLNSISLYFLLKKHKLIDFHNYYVSIFYLIFCFYFLRVSFIFPLFINFLIIIFILPSLLTINEKSYQPEHGIVFGIFCGIISLFYAPFILFFIFAFVIFQLNGLYFWKNYIMPLIGLLILYIYFFSFLYFFDFNNYSSLFSFYINQFRISVFNNISFNYLQYIIYGCFLLLFLLFSYTLLSKSSNMNIITRKKYYSLLISSLLSIAFGIFFKEKSHMFSIVFLSLISILGGISEQFIKYRIVYNIIILILLISIILNCCIPNSYA